MAFTAGSPALAKAEKLAKQLSDLYSAYGTTAAVAGNGIEGPADALARRLGFVVTGLTTGSGFAPFGTKAVDGLTHSTDGTAALGTTLGANTGLTIGIARKSRVRFDRPNAGKTFENFVSFDGLTASVYFGTAGGSVS